ncbi:Integrator complex subunit 8 [Acipenser ruthenus]|uniref:Integrator complex subunit 8 n=1 Tax=Acipenser ruthenus TaxID=7906 RepID=A0A444TZU3_ACIRT|nr:Integrator complex subunit 8 [Acipenser ruthenus]
MAEWVFKENRMSAEAADREAVTGSRPCTPPQTSWFEFLLDDTLLESHLQKFSPDPMPVQLITQFLEQASKPSVNEQNQVQPPADNRRNRTLKLLALKVAAHLKWNLDVLEKGLSIAVLNMLVNELLCVSKVPPGVKHVDLDLSTLPPTTAMAVLVYNRWAIRTTVQSSFPIKQAKPGPHQMNMLNHVQQEKELTENILKVLKEQADDFIMVLEGVLGIKKDFYVHTMRTLDLLAAEPCTANGETECSTAGLRISADELHCQVRYDLGTVFFQQGCTNPPCYEKAREHFLKTRELLSKLGDGAVHCRIDEKRLAGYCQACGVLTGSSDVSDMQSTPFTQIHNFIRSGNYKGLIEIFLEDNLALSLPNHFRQSVLREFFQKAEQGNKALNEVCYKICACNAVRDVLEGQVISVQFRQLLLKPTKEKIDFLLEVCTRSLKMEHISDFSKRNMAAFLKNLCQSLEDLQFVVMISSHELLMVLLKDDERKALTDQIRKRSSCINLCTKPLTSFYDIPASASVNIGQLEHQLILSVDPWRIRQILIELHGMTERQFWRVSSKWEVPSDYSSVILGIKDYLTRDLVYILMAKGLHCIAIKDFVHARQLFSACLELVTEFSPRLRQVMLNEMLLLDISVHEAGAGSSRERPPPDLVSRVRGYLEMRIHDIPLRQVVGEEGVAFMLNWRENEYLTLQVPTSLVHKNPYVKVVGEEGVAFMLNWRENEYLTLQVPTSLVHKNPYVKLGQLLAATCKELPGPKESRRTAKDLWEVVVQICSLTSQHKRANDGRVSLIKQRESTLGIMPSLQSVDVEAVAITMKELVNYALTLNPNNHSWLITQADIYFVTNQYSAALHFYLQAGAVCSDFFNKTVPPDVYTDQIKAIGQTELNASNPEDVLQLAAQKRKKKFLQAMAKLYF